MGHMSVTPCTRHIQISPSPCIPASWQPFSCVCHQPYTTHVSRHLYPCHHRSPLYDHVSRRMTLHASQHPLLPCQHSTLPYPPLTPLVLFWHTSCATLWNMCHVCTHMCPNWVIPTVHWILWDEIHCVVMSCSMSYCCLPRSNCKFHFNSTCPNTLAYLLSPISQNHLSISARHSTCLCSI